MMLRTLGRLFSLKPYGNDLVDGMTQLWLLLAAVNIASIALCDAVAWAYFGYTTAHGPIAWVTAAVAGVIVFMLVGSLDAMFVMQDRAEGRSVWRERAAVGARVILVILTFTVTAPFLTQLFFARDIEANIRRANEQRLGSKRNEIADRLASRRRDLEKEIAGSGASGRFGRGPTAAAIEHDVVALQSEVTAFDAATPEMLASRYGIDLVREGPDTRARVIAELEKSESFRVTRRTIKAFLVFMFLGLVALKLFQPESVRIYYSAKLQAAYARAKEQRGLTPVGFAEWYEHEQRVRELTDRLQTREDAVRVLHESLRTDLARMNEDLAAASKASDELEQQIASMQQELSAMNVKVVAQQQELDDFRYDFGDDVSLRDQQLLIATRSRTERALATNRAAAETLAASIRRLTSRLDANRAYENQLRDSFAEAGREMAILTTSLQQVRQRRLGEIVTGG